jgi:hypothetical protein
LALGTYTRAATAMAIAVLILSAYLGLVHSGPPVAWSVVTGAVSGLAATALGWCLIRRALE